MWIDELKEKVLANIRITETGCWLWTGSCNKHGYGQIGFKYMTLRAHRVSWLIYNGPFPDSVDICHHCDIKCCVNPDHLFLGTAKDNSLDAKYKGRLKGPRNQGMNHARARLTDNDVREILISKLTNAELATLYKTTEENICMIRKGKRWKHVKSVNPKLIYGN